MRGYLEYLNNMKGLIYIFTWLSIHPCPVMNAIHPPKQGNRTKKGKDEIC